MKVQDIHKEHLQCKALLHLGAVARWASSLLALRAELPDEDFGAGFGVGG